MCRHFHIYYHTPKVLLAPQTAMSSDLQTFLKLSPPSGIPSSPAVDTTSLPGRSPFILWFSAQTSLPNPQSPTLSQKTPSESPGSKRVLTILIASEMHLAQGLTHSKYSSDVSRHMTVVPFEGMSAKKDKAPRTTPTLFIAISPAAGAIPSIAEKTKE